jgi:hypothetical protein
MATMTQSLPVFMLIFLFWNSCSDAGKKAFQIEIDDFKPLFGLHIGILASELLEFPEHPQV